MKLKLTFLYLIICFTSNLFAQFDENQKVWIDDIDKALSAPDRVYHLDLSDRSLQEIPDYLHLFSNLISLNLADNDIKTINENINGLKDLTYLELSGNNIEYVDFTLLEKFKFTLTDLWLRDNRIEKIDSTINCLKYLEILELGGNQIENLSDAIELRNLKKIGLDNNFFKAVPKCLDRSFKLSQLNLNGNEIESIELSSSKRNLINLNIGDNPILNFSIDEKVKYKIEFLVLDWIKIKTEWLSNLPPSIHTLSMEHCELSSISGISHLKKLSSLSIMYNDLENIAHELESLSKLEKIWIKGNNIDAQALKTRKTALIIVD